MGVNVLIDSATMKDIADAIREKNGETTEYLPSEMAAAILAIKNPDNSYKTGSNHLDMEVT